MPIKYLKNRIFEEVTYCQLLSFEILTLPAFLYHLLKNFVNSLLRDVCKIGIT